MKNEFYDNLKRRKSWIDPQSLITKSNIHVKKVLMCKDKDIEFICTPDI